MLTYTTLTQSYQVTGLLTSIIVVESSLFYKRVPVSCCLTLVDPLTGWPTGTYRNIEQCQNWEYGPPRFTDGPHNDAIYYRASS